MTNDQASPTTGLWADAMGVALDEACHAAAHGDVPVGAVVLAPAASSTIVSAQTTASGAAILTPTTVDATDTAGQRSSSTLRPARQPASPLAAQPMALVARAGNERELTGDPTAHAEILALRRAAAALGTWRLDGCTLVVTLEPCTMCAGALVSARISRLVLGAWDPKAGAVSSLWDVVRDPRLNHRINVVAGVRAAEAESLLQAFFASKR